MPRKVLSFCRTTAATTIGAPDTRARSAATVGKRVVTPKKGACTFSNASARGPRSIISPTISFRPRAWRGLRAVHHNESVEFLRAQLGEAHDLDEVLGEVAERPAGGAGALAVGDRAPEHDREVPLRYAPLRAPGEIRDVAERHGDRIQDRDRQPPGDRRRG